MAQIFGYLRFDGNCREAMQFYKDCLGGELNMMTIAESPMADQFPAETGKNVLHADLTHDTLKLLGSDMMWPGELDRGNANCLSLVCDSNEDVSQKFTNLSAGGDGTHPPHDFFAGKMAQLKDKYGVEWILYHDDRN